jgi:hypothetical protein
VPNISPCVYPGCRDIDGNARLTRDVICMASRRHYRQLLDRLALEYVQLHVTLPAPAVTPGERVMRVVAREYGHPAEWASDACRAIADQFGEAHDGLADHLGHTPPPHPGNRETGRVAAAHHYLTMWFDQLCVYPAAGDTAEALHDLDKQVRRGLGHTDPRRHLPAPCPQCELLTLVRSLDATNDEVDCRACGYVIPAVHYGAWTHLLLDHLMDVNPPNEGVG